MVAPQNIANDAGGWSMLRFSCGSCGKLLFKFRGEIDKVSIKCPKCKQVNTLTTAEAKPPRVIDQIRYISRHQ